MKKYILILTSLGVLTVFGLTGFVKVVKPGTTEARKISPKGNPAHQLGLYTHVAPQPGSEDANAQQTILDKESREQLLQNISKLPLMFQKNMGQWQKEVLYMASAEGTKVGFRNNGVTFYSSRELDEHGEGDDKEDGELHESMTWNLNFKSMNDNTEIVAEGEQPGVTNYLLGNDSTKWVKNTPESRLINYKGIYDKIDLHYYGLENHKLEYDYIVKPGGKISSIVMELEGAGNLKINNKGELIITTPWGEIAEAKPYSYQMIKGEKKEVDVRYQIIDEKTFGFKAHGKYNKNHNLVIDPKTMIWTTFVEGNAAIHYVYGIGIDANRNSYIGGFTDPNFEITAGVVQTTQAGDNDAFVSKFNRWGTALVYSTYLGGSGYERAYAVTAGANGTAYITGRTNSSNYPVSNAAYSTLQGGDDIFISALNATGTGFVYSTYFGSGSADMGFGLYVNASNQLYITGVAQKTFPTTAGVYLPNASAPSGRHAFVIRLGSAGAVNFCTLLGGSSDDYGRDIYVSTSGEIYVTGDTDGNFPAGTNPGFDASTNGGQDAFVAKLDANATTLIYSTYLGGSGDDVGEAIFVRNDEAYVTGGAGTGFPTTAGAFRTAFLGGASDVFVTKLNTAGNGLVYSTYLGGSGIDNEVNNFQGSDIAVNTNGEAYVGGITGSSDFPHASATKGGYDQTFNLKFEGFVSLLNATGTGLLCSTYIGAEGDDYKRMSIALDLSSSLQDTLYGTLTTHSKTAADPSPGGTMYIVQTQGTVHSDNHLGADDEPYVFKMASCAVPPLPVTLMSFKGSGNGEHNFLEWTTATEVNNDYFTIERSSDGINFAAIGTVDGAGNSSNLLNYSFLDQNEGDKVTYYRLKQTDIDGKTTYSKIVMINAPDADKALQLIVTSPVTDYLNYRVCCLLKGEAKVEVIDMTGKVVISANVQVNEGYNKLTLDVKDLAEATYVLTLTSSNGTVSAKFVK